MKYDSVNIYNIFFKLLISKCKYFDAFHKKDIRCQCVSVYYNILIQKNGNTEEDTTI